jgi:hypothetical protein
MAPVYSTRLLTLPGVLGTSTSYTVAEGFVAIVKAVTVYSSGSAFDISAFLEDDATGAALLYWSWGAAQPAYHSYYGGIVFEAGEGFHFQVDTAGSAGVDCSASGYLLTA